MSSPKVALIGAGSSSFTIQAFTFETDRRIRIFGSKSVFCYLKKKRKKFKLKAEI
jgi:alpha-galactosidase/6-phospho-beta-glucosidase family protein